MPDDTPAKPTVGFVGLGTMGAPLATRLLPVLARDASCLERAGAADGVRAGAAGAEGQGGRREERGWAADSGRST